jgi:uncharacterized membrane protein
MTVARLSLLFLLSACASQELAGEPSGAPCDAELNYADIAPLMVRYCGDCHGSSVPLEQRQGAPGNLNFDTEAGLLEHAERIDQLAAAGPLAVNRSMPPASHRRKPSDAERALLGEWLACQLAHDAAQHDHAHHSH